MFLGVPFEPPIQRKKRTTGPSTSLSNNFYESPGRLSDDYQLLGANDKFVTNVKYRSKSHGRAPSPPKQQKLSKKTVGCSHIFMNLYEYCIYRIAVITMRK